MVLSWDSELQLERRVAVSVRWAWSSMALDYLASDVQQYPVYRCLILETCDVPSSCGQTPHEGTGT